MSILTKASISSVAYLLRSTDGKRICSMYLGLSSIFLVQSSINIQKRHRQFWREIQKKMRNALSYDYSDSRWRKGVHNETGCGLRNNIKIRGEAYLETIRISMIELLPKNVNGYPLTIFSEKLHHRYSVGL